MRKPLFGYSAVSLALLAAACDSPSAPPAAAVVAIVSGDGQAAAAGAVLPLPLTVKVTDSRGRAVGGELVTFAVAGGGGSVAPDTVRTSAAGTAAAAWTLGRSVGAQTVTARVAALPPATFTATASSPTTITVAAPLSGAAASDTVQVAVAVASSYSTTGVTAAVQGRAAVLALGGGLWRGQLVLTGLAAGNKQLVVTVHDAAGGVDSVAVPIVFNPIAVMTVLAPAAGSVARPSIRVAASCPACAAVQVRRHNDAGVLASGTTGVDTAISLASFNGAAVTLDFVATSTQGQSTTQTRDIYVESSPLWIPVDSAGTRVLDVSADRILFADSSAAGVAVKLRDRATGAETLVMPRVSTGFYGYLAPHGAILVEAAVAGVHVREWRDGVLVDLGPVTPAISLVVDGAWAAWSNGTEVLRRDLDAGVTTLVDANAAPGTVDVGPNGDVVYTNPSHDIVRYRAGVATPLTSGDDAVQWNMDPVTDGINVVFARRAGCCSGGQIVLVGPGGESVLHTRPGIYSPWTKYQTTNGWTAFVKSTVFGGQLWIRSPTGVLTAKADFYDNHAIEALGPDGRVVYFSVDATNCRFSECRYVASPAGAPVRTGNEWPWAPVQHPRAWWIDGSWYVALGRGVFRLNL